MMQALSTHSLHRRVALTALLVKKYAAEMSMAAGVLQKSTRLRDFREQEVAGLQCSLQDLQQELSRQSLKPVIDSAHDQACWDLMADIARQQQVAGQQLAEITQQQEQQRQVLEKLAARSRFYRDYHSKLVHESGQRVAKQERAQLLDLYLLTLAGNRA